MVTHCCKSGAYTIPWAVDVADLLIGHGADVDNATLRPADAARQLDIPACRRGSAVEQPALQAAPTPAVIAATCAKPQSGKS
jgi:hypothetical protein